MKAEEGVKAEKKRGEVEPKIEKKPDSESLRRVSEKDSEKKREQKEPKNAKP